MLLGKCSGCGNKAEIHEGPNGRAFCEDCLGVKQVMPSNEGAVYRTREPEKKDKYIEYIVTNATDIWIDKFLSEWKREMKRSMGWVTELRQEDDEMKLLRLASELGYGKKTDVDYKSLTTIVGLDKKNEYRPTKVKRANTNSSKKKSS